MEGKATSETRFFALSWMPTPETLLTTVRDYWAIENALHWQLDVSFREDAARNRKDNGPGNIAVLRRRTLGVVRRDPSKMSLSMKLKSAGWDDKFLRQLLNNISVTCSIPDDHIAPRRSALFMARWVLTEARDGRARC